MRLRTSRLRGSYALAVIASCLGVYAVLAVAFHWLLAPTMAKSQGPGRYNPTPATIVLHPVPPPAAPVRSEPPSRVVSMRPTPATLATESAETTATAVPKKTKKAARRPPRQEQPARDFWNPFNFAAGPFGGSRSRF